MKLLLDTCSIIWTVSEPEKLTNRARELLKHPDSQIFVSVISCAEIACAAERGRIQIDRHWKIWFRYFVELNGWQTVPIDLEIMEEAYSLPDHFHQDPADRIIVATARIFSCSLVTADNKLLEYPHVQTLW